MKDICFIQVTAGHVISVDHITSLEPVGHNGSMIIEDRGDGLLRNYIIRESPDLIEQAIAECTAHRREGSE